MGLQGSISVEFGAVFPDGAYAAGGFEKVRDFDRSSGDRVVQQTMISAIPGTPLPRLAGRRSRISWRAWAMTANGRR